VFQTRGLAALEVLLPGCLTTLNHALAVDVSYLEIGNREILRSLVGCNLVALPAEIGGAEPKVSYVVKRLMSDRKKTMILDMIFSSVQFYSYINIVPLL